MPSNLHCDEAHWPVVLITAPVQWGPETVARYVEDTARCAARGTPFALVLDLTENALLPTHSRSTLNAHRRWLFEHAGASLVCEAVVARSRTQREFFSLVSDRGHAPLQIFASSRADAIDAALGGLRAAGVSLESVPLRRSGVALRPLHKARLLQETTEALFPLARAAHDKL